MRNPHAIWNDEKDEVLRRHYAALGPKLLAHRLGMSTSCVARQAGKLGLLAAYGERKGKQPTGPHPRLAPRPPLALEERASIERAILSLRRRGDFVWREGECWMVNYRDRLDAAQLIARAERVARRDHLLMTA